MTRLLAPLMYSWKSTLFCACRPPLITFRHGTGSSAAFAPPRMRRSGRTDAGAATRAATNERARMAFAYMVDFHGVLTLRVNAE